MYRVHQKTNSSQFNVNILTKLITEPSFCSLFTNIYLQNFIHLARLNSNT